MIELGLRAKDKVTGFTGVITGRSQWITGCDQYCIVPKMDKEGKLEDGKWFDEGRIQIIGKGIKPESLEVEEPGGPQADAPQAR